MTDDELIARAGGSRANPFQVRERIDWLEIVDTRTREIVDYTSRFSDRAHTMSSEAHRLWLVELRAAQQPEPTPPAPAAARCATCGSDGEPCPDCNPIPGVCPAPRVLWTWAGNAAALSRYISAQRAA